MTYTPWVNRKVGVELEFTPNKRDGLPLPNLQTINGMVQRRIGFNRVNGRTGYYHSQGQLWDVKTDGSCGFEIASAALPLDHQMKHPEFSAVCALLHEDLQVKVDNRCGLHVHVDASDYDWQDMQNLVRLWVRWEPFFYELQPQARSRNMYCPPLRAAQWSVAVPPNGDLTSIMRARDRGAFERAFQRYSRRAGLNVTRWWREGHVEFRLGAGTVVYEKVRKWAALMASVVARPKQTRLPEIKPMMAGLGQKVPEVDTVWNALGMKPTQTHQVAVEVDELKEWVIHRRTLFSAWWRPTEQVTTPSQELLGRVFRR